MKTGILLAVILILFLELMRWIRKVVSTVDQVNELEERVKELEEKLKTLSE